MSYSRYNCHKSKSLITVPWFPQSMPEHWEKDGISHGYSWSRTTVGAQVDLLQRRSVMDSGSTSASLSDVLSVFHILKTDRHSIHVIDVGHYTMGHPLPPNYRWSSSLLHSTVPVSLCLQCLGSSLQRERNCVHFESPIVGANACKTDIPNGRGPHFIACTFCFLTKPTNEPGDTARQKQSSSILELATYCYNVLKKQLSPLSWHKAVRLPHELSHIQLKWWWECTAEREKLHFSWHDSLSPQSSFMYANANSKDGSVGLEWGEGE